MDLIDIVFVAGGTGGHIFPAIAIARRLIKEKPDVKILFLGRGGSMEEDLIKSNDFPFQTVEAVMMKRSVIGVLRFLMSYPVNIVRSLLMLNRLKPSLVMVTGGYVAGTVGTAAFLRRIPLVLQEQNSIPGLASRLLNVFASKTFLGYPKAEKKLLRKSTSEYVGNPVRDEIGKLIRTEGCRILGCRSDRLNILIIGGSQGAESVNRAMEAILTEPVFDKNRINLIWQCGKKDQERIRAACENAGIEALVEPFFHRIDAVYSAADVAVCRGGAVTLAELSKAGIPMIIIPFKYATANHQMENAVFHQSIGSALVVKDDEHLVSNLLIGLQRLLGSDEVRNRMSQSAKRFQSKGTGRITDYIMELLER
ncbi:MAG: undecaprenyldiphospho-muramoylpentapeptide beta-N-acetylglucosaminyltransferase [candidate division Zixibacteria bacterium]|nr:undecaprenyldiphospho-muramoylpentapeptide beta-N-acetylglucosaminyltransferase [candidate division Zixibacteria bacterium]